MRLKFTIFALFAAAILIGIYFVSGGKNDLDITAKKEKTFVYCVEGSPDNMVPFQTSTGTTLEASAFTIFERLVEFELGGTKVIPGLAKSWNVSEDGLVYTFVLRDNAAFQTTKDFAPSRTFNADDVLFSFDRQGNAHNPYHEVTSSNYIYYDYSDFKNVITKIEKVDDYTVAFHLNQANSTFLSNLALPAFSISSKEYADKMENAGTKDNYDKNPVGTGPFQFVSYQKDSAIRYKAHPDYWQGKAKLDNLVYSIVPDASVRAAKIKAGECHVIAYPNPADLEDLEKDPNVTLAKKDALNVGYVAFNQSKKPFDDVRVREALAIAVDRQQIIDAVFAGRAIQAKNPIPKSMWGHHDGLPDIEYNPARAKELLAEAGYENGFNTTLWAMPVQRPYMPNARKAAELIQAAWANIGVTAEIVSYEWGTYVKNAKEGEHEALMMGWSSDNGDPDNFLNALLSCNALRAKNNFARWCYKDFDDLLLKATEVADIEERTKFYHRAQEIFREQYPWMLLAHSQTVQPIYKNVENFTIIMIPGSLHNFYPVDLKD